MTIEYPKRRDANGTHVSDAHVPFLWDKIDEVVGALNGRVAASGGFIDYNDASTASVPINLSGQAWTDLPNDGLGAFTNTAYAPPGVTSLMDNSTGYIDPTQLKLGDTMLIRNDYTITPNINNTALEFRYVLGTGAGEYTLSNVSRRLDLGAGIGYRIASGVDLIYMGDTNTRDNPIKLQVRLSNGGTLTVAGSVIQVIQGGGSQ